MKRKYGVSLITLIILIVVILILAGAVILTLGKSNPIDSAKEANFKLELKSYDEQIRAAIGHESIYDEGVINRVITDRNEIKKYCKELVNSQYIGMSYISTGVLTLRGSMITDIQRKWAIEANIKIDDSVTVTDSVYIELDEEAWTKGPINATVKYTGIPNGYRIEYKVGEGDWTPGETTPITENTTVYGRLYNNNIDDEIATNSKDVTNIDNTPPTVPTSIEFVEVGSNNIKVKASGSIDTGCGMLGYMYSIDDNNYSDVISEDTEYNITSLTAETEYTIYVKAVDKLNNVSIGNYNENKTTDKIKYTLTFDANGGTCSTTSITEKEGETITLPSASKTGATFAGWYTAARGGARVTYTTMPSSSSTVYAHYKYSLIFDANEGTCDTRSITKEAGESITLPTASKTGATFAGWYTAKSGGTQVTYTTMPSSSRTVYAHYTYTLTFNANGGTCDTSSITKEAGERITLPTASSTTEFLGWYTSSTGGTKVTYTKMPASSQTLYAIYKTNKSIRYSVTTNLIEGGFREDDTHNANSLVVDYVIVCGMKYTKKIIFYDVPAGTIIEIGGDTSIFSSVDGSVYTIYTNATYSGNKLTVTSTGDVTIDMYHDIQRPCQGGRGTDATLTLTNDWYNFTLTE